MTEKCEKCGGTGRVEGEKLDNYEKPEGLLYDDTEYTCDWCDGEGHLEMCY